MQHWTHVMDIIFMEQRFPLTLSRRVWCCFLVLMTDISHTKNITEANYFMWQRMKDAKIFSLRLEPEHLIAEHLKCIKVCFQIEYVSA